MESRSHGGTRGAMAVLTLAVLAVALLGWSASAPAMDPAIETVTDGGAAGAGPACPVVCPPGGVDENEPCGAALNNGCSGTCPKIYQGLSHLQCGKTGCGSIFADNFQLDEDWWVFTLPLAPLTGERYVCITVESEFPAVVQLWTGTNLCLSATLLAQYESSDCNTLQVCQCLPNVPNNTYYIRIWPGTIGAPIWNGLPCSAAGRDYTVRLDCEDHCPGNEPVFGACCLPSTSVPCLQTTQTFCDGMGWIYAGDGVPCDQTSCPNFGACCHQFPGSTYYPCTMTWEDDCLNSGNYIDPTFFAGLDCSHTAVHCPGAQCGPGGGPCDLANGTPGCDNQTCCDLVCNQQGMPQCCAVEWDQTCAMVASEVCFDVIDPAKGQCCYVIDEQTGQVDCIASTEADCLTLFGSKWFPSQPCDLHECEESLFELGACCYMDPTGASVCDQMTLHLCDDFGGTWLAGIACNPDPCTTDVGACCFSNADGNHCQDGLSAAECDLYPVSAHYPGLTCADVGDECGASDPGEPEDGACCRPDPASGGYFCFEASFAFCDSLPDTIFHPGLDCTDPVVIDVCELGEPRPELSACCHRIPGSLLYTCTMLTEDDCHDQPDSTFFPGEDCNDIPAECCKQKILSACCYTDAAGVVHCDDLTACECELLPGSTFNPGVHCADLGPDCGPVVTGACCFPFTPLVWTCADSLTAGQCATFAGSQFHPGLTCTDPIVLETCELGACCYIDPATGEWTCADLISAPACATVPDSQFHPGQLCADIECPKFEPVGACCRPVFNGATGVWVCTVGPAADCAAVAGIYQGDGTSCTPNPCPTDCITPPKGLVAWWTLDDGPPPPPSALDSSGLNSHGTRSGPIVSIPGAVNDAMQFNGIDDFIRVPSNQWLNVCPSNAFCLCAWPWPCPMQHFTIDAWIRLDSLPAAGSFAPIVSKLQPGPSQRGYGFIVDEDARLGLLLEDLCGPAMTPTLSSPTGLAVGDVAHVAVTVSRPFPGTSSVATFYVNGNAISSHNISAWPCSLINGFPLMIARMNNWYFHGMIDEVQIFRRALNASEVLALYNAGAMGKCKHRCTGSTTSICRNHASKAVNTTVCNDSPIAQTYEVSYAPVTGGSCQPGLVVPGPQIVTVPPLSCQTISATMTRPAGLASGLTWCYDIQVENLASGQVTNCTGTLVNYHNFLCNLVVHCCLQKYEVGKKSALNFEIHPPDPGQPHEQNIAGANWRIRAMVIDPDFDEHISLNGQDPGEVVTGSFSLAPGDPGFAPVILSAEVEFLDHAPREMFHIVLEMQADGDASYVPVASVPIESDVADPCPADLTGDGVVNVFDLLQLLAAWGPCPLQIAGCPGDLNIDAVVNVFDLLELLAAWGPCVQ